ncbi:MAG: cell division protein FtsW [Clostridia bacterium]|nr:cell division protein FtsW [Clostridia bacterium]
MENNKKNNNPMSSESKSIRKVISEYMEQRREKNYRADESFHRAITPDHTRSGEAKRETVIYRNGVDTRFLIYIIVLLCFGAVMMYSATYVSAEQKFGDGAYFFIRYVIFAVAAIAITIPFVIYGRPWFWKCFGTVVYVSSVLLLILVLLPIPGVSASFNGAQRWLDFGIITIQPSEIAKMGVVMMLAFYMSKYDKKLINDKSWKKEFRYGVFYPAFIFGFICALVMLEKHISGVMIIGMIGIALMFMGGTRQKWIFMIIGAIGVAGCLLILVSDYAQLRVNTWLNIDQVDPLGDAYQTLQGLYAIGSGGLFGVGLGNSRQKYGYIVEVQNDFVFTIICEELGFIGAALLIGLFALVVIRGFKIAARAPDKFSSLLVFGLVFKLALQVVLNIAVVTNSMPNTGISLPFFSAGGTALALQIFEMGIILSVSRFSTVKKK